MLPLFKIWQSIDSINAAKPTGNELTKRPHACSNFVGNGQAETDDGNAFKESRDEAEHVIVPFTLLYEHSNLFGSHFLGRKVLTREQLQR